tara:strand:+ start:2586 stop:3161 length:576 start_codon:yes stop_codon:yes gene_type:complete
MSDFPLFEKLNKVDVNKHKKQKGQFDYLSWPLAVRELLKVCPDASWQVHEYQNEDGLTAPFMTTNAGCFVRVSVTCDEVTRSQVHPVTDNRNQTIAQPTAQDINTSIQRCLAKAIALHGLGLYIFAGEDLPEPDALNSEQRSELLGVVKKLKNKSLESDIVSKMDSLQINVRNYEASIEKLNIMIKDKEKK